MKGSTWLFTIATFVGGIMVFSSGYGEVVRYLEQPTWTGLAMIAFWLVLLIFFVVTLGFIMYAVDRRVGNVKVKIGLFERLLGFTKDAILPEARVSPEAGNRVSAEAVNKENS